MSLGILILSYNSNRYTEQLAKVIPEAIIIDAGSTKPLNVTNEVYRLDKNLGFTQNWNEAILKYKDKFDSLWLMNNDILITRAEVERVKRQAKKYDFFSPSYNCWSLTLQNKGSGKMRDVGYLEFCAPVISRKVFDKIGLFDSDFSLGYGVEWDYCYKARKAGFKIMVDDGCTFYHYGHKTTGIELGHSLATHEQIANEEKNRVMIKKHGNNWIKKLTEGLDLRNDTGADIIVYTTIFGNYDNLKAVPKQNINARYICVTDNPKIQCPGWQVKVIEPKQGIHPRMQAKHFKMKFWEVGKADIYVYIDASIKIKSADFIEYCTRNLNGPMCLFKHPFRDNLKDEVIESRKLRKYEGIDIEGQIEGYYNSGYKDYGLFACGVMVRRDTAKLREVMTDWLNECFKFTYQDQLSAPVIFQRHNFKPATFIENQGNNDYFDVVWHDDIKTTSEAGATIVMPIYKTPLEQVKEAINSLENQSVKALIIVVDDGMNDDVRAWVGTRAGVRVVGGEHVGIGAALNIGIKEVKTEYIIRFDADDIAKGNLIQNQLEYMQIHPNAEIAGCQIQAFGAANWRTSHPRAVTAGIAFTFKNYWFVNHPGIIYRTNFIKRYMYKNEFPEDYELWTRILSDGQVIYNSGLCLVNYRAVLKPASSERQNNCERWKQRLR